MDYQQLLALFKETHLKLQQRAARSVDTSLVIRNWLFGWYIVEFEQGGAERSELYGKGLINRLSKELKTLGLKGISSTNLKLCRTFYLAYQKIGQTPPDQSFEVSAGLQKIQQMLPVTSFDVIASAPKMLQKLSATLAGSFALGWSHYVALLTISNADERRFYEIEARENSWGARELERQIAASLYERLALSRDKEGIRQLSQKGLVVEKPGDVIKEDELPTIGILLCHRKHDALVELTLPKDSNIFASKYQLYLPSKEELKRQLEEAAGIEHRENPDQEGTGDVR